jgi:MFS family permease
MTSDAANISIATTKFKLGDLLRIRNYRFLWCGQLVADFGDSMTQLALMILINRITGSVTALATLSMVIAIPRLVFGLLSGVYVDRLNRKHIMLASDLLRCFLVLAFIFVDKPNEVWILYCIGFLQGSIGTFFTPARMAILPNLVPENALLSANSIQQTSMILMYTLGNAAAGAIIGLTKNYWLVFCVNSLTYLLSFIFVSRIKYAHTGLEPGEKSLTARYMFEQLREGLKVTFGQRILGGSIVALSVTMLGIGALNVLSIPFLLNLLKVPETWIGFVNSGESVGMVLSGMILATFSSRWKPTSLIVGGLFVLGISSALTGFIQNAWVMVPVLFISGLAIPPISASVSTITQTHVPNDLRGRTGAANSTLTTTTGLISMATAGILADSIGVRAVFMIAGGFIALSGAVAFWLYRERIGIRQQVDKSIK